MAGAFVAGNFRWKADQILNDADLGIRIVRNGFVHVTRTAETNELQANYGFGRGTIEIPWPELTLILYI